MPSNFTSKTILFDGDNDCVECNQNNVHIDYKHDG